MTALAPFGPEIWTAEGPVVSFHGFAYSTRMAVIRLADGGLFIWSPVALDDALKAEIARLGEVRHLVSPNKLHHLYLAAWRRAFPVAHLWAPPGLAKKCPDLVFDGALEGAMPWHSEIDQQAFEGSFAMTEIVFFHRASRSALFCDLIENFPPDWFRGWKGLAARLGAIVAPNGSAPRDFQLSFLRRSRARRALAAIQTWHADNVIIAHGEMVRGGGDAFIARAFRWL